MTPNAPLHRVWARRIGWLLLIWITSVAALAIVATGVRTLMNLAGMTT
jgi:Protein of unknown function (DUF2474)